MDTCQKAAPQYVVESDWLTADNIGELARNNLSDEEYRLLDNAM
jgi:hypothetical protein